MLTCWGDIFSQLELPHTKCSSCSTCSFLRRLQKLKVITRLFLTSSVFGYSNFQSASWFQLPDHHEFVTHNFRKEISIKQSKWLQHCSSAPWKLLIQFSFPSFVHLETTSFYGFTLLILKQLSLLDWASQVLSWKNENLQPQKQSFQIC